MQGKKLTDDIDISTLREMEARGMMRKEIAAALDVGVDTVRRYLGPGRRGRKSTGQNTANKKPESQNTAVRVDVPVPQTQPVPVALFHAMNELPAQTAPAPTLRERLEQQVRDGVRKAPRTEKHLRIRQKYTVLDGEVGTYTLDMINRTVTIETVLHGEAAGLDDLDKLIRELQEVRDNLDRDGESA